MPPLVADGWRPYASADFGISLRLRAAPQSACALAIDVEQSPLALPRAERWPSGRRHQIANLAYWVTGTEGSNPSLSANQSVAFTYHLEIVGNARVSGLCSAKIICSGLKPA